MDGWQLGFVRAGQGGPTIVLLHGWPESSHAWRSVIPLLAGRFDVIAVDLPGIGRSSGRTGDYDKRALAEDLHLGLAGLGLGRVVLAGHDLGAMVAYAYARRHPEDVAGLVVLDQPLPGIDGWETTVAASFSWHLGFHRVVQDGAGVADVLIAGHERFYFHSHIQRFAARTEAITAADIDVYALAHAGRDQLSAGMRMFRALPVDVQHNEADTAVLEVPVVLAFGEYSGATLLEVVADGLRAVGVAEVRTVSIPDCGHWAAEEQPQDVARIIAELADRL
jgi:pimeloyl-ACP methyl ester carboxylesterase